MDKDCTATFGRTAGLQSERSKLSGTAPSTRSLFLEENRGHKIMTAGRRTWIDALTNSSVEYRKWSSIVAWNVNAFRFYLETPREFLNPKIKNEKSLHEKPKLKFIGGLLVVLVGRGRGEGRGRGQSGVFVVSWVTRDTRVIVSYWCHKSFRQFSETASYDRFTAIVYSTRDPSLLNGLCTSQEIYCIYRNFLWGWGRCRLKANFRTWRMQ